MSCIITTTEKSEQLLLVTRCGVEATHTQGRAQTKEPGLLAKALPKLGDSWDKGQPGAQSRVERGGERNNGRNQVANKHH